MFARLRFIQNGRFNIFAISSLVIFSLSVFLSGTSKAAILQSTPVCDVITTTTWTVSSSPYLVCGGTGITIPNGATLTIEPGVRVEFQWNGSITVNGTLTALGTSTQPIIFTSENGTPDPTGYWNGIDIISNNTTLAVANLDWVIVEYARSQQIYIDNGTTTIAHSIVRFGDGNGVFVIGGMNPSITDSLFQGNTFEAIVVSSVGEMNFSNLTAIGNGKDVIVIRADGEMQGDHFWPDAGIPYQVEGQVYNSPGDSLKIEPGTQALFVSNASLDIGGSLTAVGLPDQPITFTAQTPTPGFWWGLGVRGDSTTPATALFEYVTIEYGYNNLSIQDAQVQMRHSIVRNGFDNGIVNYSGGHSHTMIETSQIVDNAGYGLKNAEIGWPILAINNWWGDPSGPQLPPGSVCSQGGTGSKVSDGVIVYPVLPSPTALPVSPKAESMSLVSIKPLRWFVPATGVDRLYVEITLLNGKGEPIPGITVGLSSTLGNVTDGGVTGFDGKTLAYVTSNSAGDAELWPVVNINDVCVFAPVPTSKVTFTPATTDEGYLPESQAPYLNSGIEITPLPIVQGVSTQLSILVTNPNDFPIIVDGSFFYVQDSIGLVFGPLADVPGTQIPTNGQAEIQTTWVPPLSGRYCIRFEYTARSAGLGMQATLAGGSAQRNLNVYPGSKHPPEVQNAYDFSRKAVGNLGDASDALTLATDPAGFIGGYIPGQLFGHIINSWYETMDKIDKALTGDPPRQDFTIFSLPQTVPFTPLQAGAGISQALADAANARMTAYLDILANLQAATIANDRYGGASQAGNIQWASLQLGAVLYYEQQAALHMPALADAIDQYVAVVLQENPGDIVMTADIYQAYQERLQTQGFNADEIAGAHLLGMTDAEIETMRQDRLALDPASTAGSVTKRLTAYAQTLRDLSSAILNPAGAVFNTGGLAGLAAQANIPNDNLAHLFASDVTVQVGNPYSATETVTLVIRPIDLPPDWLVTISPSSPTLAPGESVTVIVHISAGSPAPQGTTPSFALEGYIGGDLIGGTVLDTIVPLFTNFDGNLRIFMPVIRR